MNVRAVGVGALLAAVVLACKGEIGPAGPTGPAGPQGAIGPPGAGWTDAGSDLVTTNSGNVGIGTATPSAKLDVNGDLSAARLLFLGTRAFALERSGMITDAARGQPVTITGGILRGSGPTNEYAQGSYWETTVFPSSMSLDLGRGVPYVEQIAWETAWRMSMSTVPEWQGTGAYVLEYSLDNSTWTQIPSVAPVAGDFFVHPVALTSATSYRIRYVRLTVKAPRVPGNPVHVSMFRVLTWVDGDSTAVDARRLYVPAGAGDLRLWGQGRPGVVRYGTSGVESGLCVNAAAGVRFGLSNARVDWSAAEAACPSGTWVCTAAERGSAACDTARPDAACDGLDRSGVCLDYPPNGHWGHMADNGNQGGAEGKHMNEGAILGPGGSGNYSMPSWCCSY